MKRDGKATDQLVNKWVEGVLQSSDKLLELPLSNHFESPWGVNVLSNFLSKETFITISEAHSRKHLTLPLIEKMGEAKIVIKGASSTENLVRKRILYWYSTLSLDEALLHKDLKCKAPLIESNLRRNLGKWST